MSRFPQNQPGPQGQWGGDAYAVPVSEASAETRASFIKKTYLHVAGSLLLLAAIDALLLTVVPEATRIGIIQRLGGLTWLLVIGLFMAVSWVASSWARNGANVGLQYAGLALYTGAFALLLMLPLTIAQVMFPAGNIIGTAVLVTALITAALTAFVFITGADFSWLGGILTVCFIGVFALIAASLLFGFNLGTVFLVGMVVLMCATILYDTSNIMHHYLPGQHVAAALALFGSIATLFWYVLNLLMSLQRE